MKYRILVSNTDTTLFLEETNQQGKRRFVMFDQMSALVNHCRENGIDVTLNDIVEG